MQPKECFQTTDALEAPLCFAFRLQTAGLHAHADHRHRVAGLLLHIPNISTKITQRENHMMRMLRPHAQGGRHVFAFAAGMAEACLRPRNAGTTSRREQPAALSALLKRVLYRACLQACPRACT
eukprot:6202590-Pleurochrysis_carterae.AAC.1